jgi:hypothetical protein
MERLSKVEQRLTSQIVTSFYEKPEMYGLDGEALDRGKKYWLTKSGLILSGKEMQVWKEITAEDHKK